MKRLCHKAFMLSVTAACHSGGSNMRPFGCAQPPTTGPSRTLSRGSLPDSSIPRGYGRIVLRLIRADSTRQPIDSAFPIAHLNSNLTVPNTFQFSQLERTSGRYVTTALAGSVVVDVGRHGFKPGTDTLIVREGFADTLEMALVPHVLCVEEVVKRGKP